MAVFLLNEKLRYKYLVFYMELNIIIPDTNVILAASFDTIYDGTIPMGQYRYDTHFMMNRFNY